MKDYVRKLVVNKWIRDELSALFKIERTYDTELEQATRKRRELNSFQDMLEDSLHHGAVTVYEYYIIIGYLTEYALGSHFEDLPSV